MTFNKEELELFLEYLERICNLNCSDVKRVLNDDSLYVIEK